jgi:hypothetical protein
MAGGMAGDGGAGGLAGEFFGLARLDRFGPLGR